MTTWNNNLIKALNKVGSQLNKIIEGELVFIDSKFVNEEIDWQREIEDQIISYFS
jgi:hypothetical protein